MAGILPSLAFLGAGSMARAIIEGVRNAPVQLEGPIRVTNRSAAAAAMFDGVVGIIADSVDITPDANRIAAAASQLVVVAVKPAMVVPLLDEIADALQPGSTVVSVAAGVTTATMESRLPEHVSVVRTMPNTPAQVGRAVTGIAGGARADREALDAVVTLFETVGSVIVTEEARIDALSTVSGSGPAYVFYLIEQLEAAARALGFSADESTLMVRETFAGSLDLLDRAGIEPAELRRRVTSPNGTTERAIATFDAADIAGTFRAATEAALARAREMAASA
ncbi:MAG TPA: pyrroline-5-carboxylate reductase [Microbacteriaceae bacterium]|nr:pyrroline-5-carboxylate reductase [Microbacteriaceae bacterium]